MKQLVSFFLCVILCVRVTVYGQGSFAGRLQRDGDYRFAALEYERALFTEPDRTERSMLHYRLGTCYYRLQAWRDAAASYDSVAAASPLRDSAMLHAAECMFFLKAYPDTYRYCARSALSGGALLAQVTSLYHPPPQGAAGPDTAHRFSRLDSMKMARLRQIERSWNRFTPRSPLVGGLLGIVPGLGHLYGARPRDGLFSALVVATFGGIAGYYYHFDAPNRAAALGSVAGLFYAGSMYGAAVSVRLYNEDTVRGMQEHAVEIYFE